MTFISEDEHIIILDYNIFQIGELNSDELSKLKDAGIKTVNCYMRWNLTEPSKGVYDWSQIDAEVYKIHKAGLKAMICTYFSAPPFFPDDWYIRATNGDIQRHIGYDALSGEDSTSTLSYWNPNAWDYHLRFIEKVCDHFLDSRNICINVSPANGEALIPGDDYLFDDYALTSYRQFTKTDGIPGNAVPGSATLDWLRETVIPCQVETQRIFQWYYDEYWTMLHHAFETIPSTGNWLIDDLYVALHNELGDEHWGMCYTVYRPGETRGLWGPKRDIERYGVKMFYASEGPAGLLANTRDAMCQGARGMLTGPLTPYLGSKRLEDWMYDAIRESGTWWTR